MKAANKLVPFDHEIDGVTFQCKPLSGIAALEVSDYAEVLENGDVILPARSCKAALKYGLIGWDLKDDDGDVEFGSPASNLEALYFGVIKELATVIIGRSELSSEDTKKS